MSRLPAIFHQIVSTTGAPVSGGKLYTYISGTTTNKATYPTAADLAALTNANPNPIVAGADGICGPIYLIAGEPYKFVEKTSAGVMLRTEDVVYSAMLTSDSLITRVQQIASNPIDYGAIGDGTSDESSYVQSAIDGVSGNGVVDLLGLKFRCDNKLNLPSSVRLRNGIVDFSQSTDAGPKLTAEGNVGAANLLTANGTFGDASVAVTSASGLASGDLMLLYDTRTYTDSGDRGELFEIESIASLTVKLQGFVMDDYATASSAAVKAITPIDDVTLEDLEIVGAEGLTGSFELIQLINTRRTRISNCHIVGIDTYGITVRGCYDVKIENCTIDNGAFGIGIGDATTGIQIENCLFTGLDCGIITDISVTDAGAAQGCPRKISIRGNQFVYGGGSAYQQILIDQVAEFVTIAGNEIFLAGTGALSAILVGCVNAEISGNSINRQGTGTPFMISLSTQVPLRVTSRGFAIRVKNNRINTDGEAIIYSDLPTVGGSSALSLLEISGNDCGDLGTSDVFIDHATDALSPVLSLLLIHGNRSAGTIEVLSTTLSVAMTRCRILNNTAAAMSATFSSLNNTSSEFRGNTVAGNMGVSSSAAVTLSGNDILNGTLTCASCTAVRIQGGSITRAAGRALLVDECTQITIQGVDVTGTTGGIEVDNTSQEFARCHISGCAVSTSGAGHGIEIDASDTTGSLNLSILGNTITCSAPGAGGNCISVTGKIQTILVGNNNSQRGDDSAANIQLTGDAATNIQDAFITGNILSNGTYGIAASNNGTTRHFANTFLSMATGDTNGTFTTMTGQTYTVTNGTTDRSYDADTALVTETNDIMYTLLNDLQSIGVLTRS